ncbi:MAG: DNA translocase FtsK 4TM domain-containing protein [Coriobacteriia bacterium]|nr:DNA translocase FtsK 4TM domain-containing protein [Coriobacteriia bacterium]
MAAARKNNSTSKGRSAGGAKTTKGGSRRKPVEPPPVLDAESRHEIIGIVTCALAVALAIAVLSGSQDVVPRAVATALKLGFGVGAYAIPVAALLLGVSFFVRAVRIDETRVGIGLALILLAGISLVAVATPEATQWTDLELTARGGYVGGGIAWGLRTLLGPAIAYVALAAVMLVGLVFAGMSISELVERATFMVRGDAEEPPFAEDTRRHRASKTVPLEEFAAEEDAARADKPARNRSARPDLEAVRPTVPTAGPIAPRRLEGFELPPISALRRSPESAASHRASERELKHTAGIIEQTLATFDISARVIDWISGPTVTLFEVELAKGIKVNRITSLADDLALALAAPTIRILAPIPGKSYVGIEVPNAGRTTVTLGDVLAGAPMNDPNPLLLAIGKDVSGDQITADLAAMPHLLIAGSTGTGKSVCINALITTIMMRATPAEVRLILIDPKRIELNLYNGVPHLYVPVVTEAKEAASALYWAVSEMDARLKKLQKAGVRNIAQYNANVHDGKAPEDAEELPYLIIVIDELADLMMVAAREVEDSICRIAQLARAAGIHLIVATQRPSTDIITGLIKTNITNRIAFAVGSSIDSRVVLDQSGAEKLVGLGDMLFSTPAWPKPKRIQGAYVSEDEINAVVEHLKNQAEPDYHEEILQLKVTPGARGGGTGDDDDPLIWEAADIAVTSGMGSTSLLQRRLKVGYARAGRIMDMLEAKGIVGPPDGSRPREVLVDVEDLESIKSFDRIDHEES